MSTGTADVMTRYRPALTTPAHGGGKIYSGGVPGHRGGSGRRPDKVRRALLGIASVGITQVLRPLIEGHPVRVIDRDGSVVEIDANPADRLRAVEITLRYALGAANKVNVEAEEALRVEWEQPDEPVLILPKLGTRWTDADQATLDKLQAVGRSGAKSLARGSPETKIVAVDG